MFDSVLVANRGEIARRIARSARKLGMRVIAVYSEADAKMPFVTEADEAHLIGSNAPAESYLNIEKLMEVARTSKAACLHPGYGFLSESILLKSACKKNGIVFVGPNEKALETMGAKVAAKAAAIAAKVPTVPGSDGAVANEDEAVKVAEQIGYPVMLKASAGGGGIGMTLCKKEKKLRASFEDNKKKGEMFFGSGEMLLEKYVENPHHIEVQVLGDAHGNVVHLYERECSVQRRNQKVLEEAPSPFISAETRDRICASAVAVASSVDYVGAGTVEFIMDENQEFYFLEMNTRLQVEHPVTEEVLGIDIVEWQFRVANGEKLDPELSSLEPCGVAIEARICAEDPEKRFFPCPGTLEKIVWPTGEGIRVEAAVEGSAEITPYYDSLIAKVIASGKDRTEAIARLREALSSTTLAGTTTNINVFEEILTNDIYIAGNYTTGFLKDVLGKKS